MVDLVKKSVVRFEIGATVAELHPRSCFPTLNNPKATFLIFRDRGFLYNIKVVGHGRFGMKKCFSSWDWTLDSDPNAPDLATPNATFVICRDRGFLHKIKDVGHGRNSKKKDFSELRLDLGQWSQCSRP